MRYFKDYCLGFTFAGVGRLLPALKVPHQNLRNKNVIVSGSNSGIGYSLALQLAEMGATVYLACRNETRAEAARLEMLKACPSADIRPMTLDTSSLRSVRDFVSAWDGKPLDILVHNAGMVAPAPASAGKEAQFSTDGFELLYQTNFLSSFLLTHLLEPCLSADSRIIFTSSVAHYSAGFGSHSFATEQTIEIKERDFHEGARGIDTIYAQGKFMQAVFALTLQEHFDRLQSEEAGKQTQRRAYSFSPGFTKTTLFDAVEGMKFSISPVSWTLRATMSTLGIPWDQGAATGVYLASSNDLQVVGTQGGGYWDRMKQRRSKADLLDQAARDRFWTRWCADAGIAWEK